MALPNSVQPAVTGPGATSTGRPPAPPARGLPFEVRLEPRLSVPRWLPAATSVLALVAAIIIGGVIIQFAGGEPIPAYEHIFNAAFGSLGQFNDTLVKSTPLILVGLACAIAFRMKLWNIGAEGQFFMGAWGASLVVLAPLLPATTPAPIMILAMMISGFICGALWGFLPGYLKARLKVNEIITTLMLNYIATLWVLFWVFGAWSERGFQMSAMFPRNAWLPRLLDYARQVPVFGGMTLHLGFLFGLLAAVLVWFIIYRSRWGYEIRLIGDNPRAANYAGINIVRNTVLVMMLSGGLAGLAGMSEITGVVHRLQGAISPGYGFTGIIIAWLAKLNPFAVVLVSILFGGLIQAGREIQPSGVPRMLQGVILFCVIASDVLLRYRIRVIRRSASAPAAMSAVVKEA
jgi:general nucleoside transport system permease protein